MKLNGYSTNYELLKDQKQKFKMVQEGLFGLFGLSVIDKRAFLEKYLRKKGTNLTGNYCYLIQPDQSGDHGWTSSCGSFNIKYQTTPLSPQKNQKTKQKPNNKQTKKPKT